MSNGEFNKHKKRDKVKWVLTTIVGILLAAACATSLTMGIKNNGWFDDLGKTPVEDTGGGETDDTDNGEIEVPDNGETGDTDGGDTDDTDDSVTVVVLQKSTFDSSDGISSNSFFTVTGNQVSSTCTTPDGEVSKVLKIETSTAVTFTTETATTLTIYSTDTYVGKTIKVDGTAYTFAENADGYIVATAELAAGDHTISKGDPAVVTYVTLTVTK